MSHKNWLRAAATGVIVGVLCGLLVGCTVGQAASPIAATLAPLSPTPDPNWQQVELGLEQRRYLPNNNVIAAMQAVRIDPAHYRFQAHYQQNNPMTIQGWRDALPAAEVIINANFFNPDYSALGLLISDGAIHGRSYREGGTLIVQGVSARVVATASLSIDRATIDHAVQAFPLLMVDGQAAYTNTRDNRVARRTLIGEDAYGRIVVLTSTGFGLGLYDSGQFLADSDLKFLNAFNLDGGGSSMLYVRASNTLVPSFDAVPAVLAAYPR